MLLNSSSDRGCSDAILTHHTQDFSIYDLSEFGFVVRGGQGKVSQEKTTLAQFDANPALFRFTALPPTSPSPDHKVCNDTRMRGVLPLIIIHQCLSLNVHSVAFVLVHILAMLDLFSHYFTGERNRGHRHYRGCMYV